MSFNVRVLIGVILVLFFVAGCKGKQKNIERNQLFDLNWKFRAGEVTRAYSRNINENQWRDIDLPHDWNSDVNLQYNMRSDSINSGIGWYRKKFTIPNDWKKKQVFLFFEGVNENPTVYINGSVLKSVPTGSTSFTIELTPFLLYHIDNLIVVCIKDLKQADGKWQKNSGIYKHVWLNIKEPVYFKQ